MTAPSASSPPVPARRSPASAPPAASPPPAPGPFSPPHHPEVPRPCHAGDNRTHVSQHYLEVGGGRTTEPIQLTDAHPKLNHPHEILPPHLPHASYPIPYTLY